MCKKVNIWCSYDKNLGAYFLLGVFRIIIIITETTIKVPKVDVRK